MKRLALVLVLFVRAAAAFGDELSPPEHPPDHQPAHAARPHADPPDDHLELGDETSPQDPGEEKHDKGEPHENAEHGDHGDHAEHHHPHHHVVNIGATGTFLASLVDKKTYFAGGGGLFVEVPLDHRYLELEVSVRALATEGGVEYSQDVLLKVPIHVNHWFNPFIGIGPTVAEYAVAGEAADLPRRHGWGIGGALAAGAHFWLNNRVGFVAELDYNLLHRWLTEDGASDSHGALVNEVGGSVGVIVGF